MCLSRASFVEAKVYDRLVERDVHPDRAAAVARKVRRAYQLKRAAARDSRPASPKGAAPPR